MLAATAKVKRPLPAAVVVPPRPIQSAVGEAVQVQSPADAVTSTVASPPWAVNDRFDAFSENEQFAVWTSTRALATRDDIVAATGRANLTDAFLAAIGAAPTIP